MICTKCSPLFHSNRSATYLVNINFFSEKRTVLEKKHHVCDLGSTATLKCSMSGSQLGQSISWYNGFTGVKIKSGGRIEPNGLSLKINNVQLDDAGSYECRGVSSTRFYTVYVNSEYSLYSFFSSLRHYFPYTSPLTIMSCCVVLRAILQESEAKLIMKNFKFPSIFVWR